MKLSKFSVYKERIFVLFVMNKSKITGPISKVPSLMETYLYKKLIKEFAFYQFKRQSFKFIQRYQGHYSKIKY